MGGLFSCTVCGGAEGSLPTECPGVRMSADRADDVYADMWDFKGGRWIDRREIGIPISELTPEKFGAIGRTWGHD